MLWICFDLLWICCGLVDVSYFQHVHMLRICCRRSICCGLVVDLLWICCEFVVDLLMSVIFSTFTCCGFVVGAFDMLWTCCGFVVDLL